MMTSCKSIYSLHERRSECCLSTLSVMLTMKTCDWWLLWYIVERNRSRESDVTTLTFQISKCPLKWLEITSVNTVQSFDGKKWGFEPLTEFSDLQPWTDIPHVPLSTLGQEKCLETKTMSAHLAKGAFKMFPRVMNEDSYLTAYIISTLQQIYKRGLKRQSQNNEYFLQWEFGSNKPNIQIRYDFTTVTNITNSSCSCDYVIVNPCYKIVCTIKYGVHKSY